MTPTPAQQTEVSAFEGLFVRALKVDGAFREDLRRAGFDVDRAQPLYPTEVWNRCIEVALTHAMPGKRREDGLRALGAVLVEGVFQTIVGSVIAVGLPMLGVERVVQRLPRYITSASIGVAMTVEKKGEREYHLTSRDAYALPELTAGMIEAGLLRTKTKTKVDVIERDPGRYVLSIRW